MIAAGVVVNFLLAWACLFGAVSTDGIVKPHFLPGVVVNEVYELLILRTQLNISSMSSGGSKPVRIVVSVGLLLRAFSMTVRKRAFFLDFRDHPPVANVLLVCCQVKLSIFLSQPCTARLLYNI